MAARIGLWDGMTSSAIKEFSDENSKHSVFLALIHKFRISYKNIQCESYLTKTEIQKGLHCWTDD